MVWNACSKITPNNKCARRIDSSIYIYDSSVFVYEAPDECHYFSDMLMYIWFSMTESKNVFEICLKKYALSGVQLYYRIGHFELYDTVSGTGSFHGQNVIVGERNKDHWILYVDCFYCWSALLMQWSSNQQFSFIYRQVGNKQEMVSRVCAIVLLMTRLD